MTEDQLKTGEEKLEGKLGLSAARYADDLTILRKLKALGLEANHICNIGGSNRMWSVMCDLVYPGAIRQIFDLLVNKPEGDELETEPSQSSSLMDSERCHFHAVSLGARISEIGFSGFQGSVAGMTNDSPHEPRNTKAMEIPFYLLDDYYSQRALPLPDIIKLDGTGAELEVMEGAGDILKHASAVVCDCWLFRGSDPKTPTWLEIANTLANYDFHLFEFGRIDRRPADQRAMTVCMVFLKRSLPFSPLRNFSP